ncbi:MAG: extracellular solute-binding protein [Limnochordia bacterium]|nr:extracellular solute-binding protein [Limnochordia bacterium]MDD2630074.1 extracellular solute-binding protein [Limnochordia bacterium]MDD4519140.1 extracellular solute-binding protein [Limnochordia bacterium]
MVDARTSNHGHTLKCIACHKPIQNEDITYCPRCKRPHHSSCWALRGGCAAVGCGQLADTVKQDKEKKTRILQEAARNRTRHRRTTIVLGCALIILLILIGRHNSPQVVDRDIIDMMTVVLPYSKEQSLARMVADYNNTDEQFFIRWQSIHPSVYDQKLVVLIGSRDVPDIFVLRAEDLTFFSEKGLLLALDEYFLADTALADAVDKETLGQWNGHVYALPFSAGRLIALHSETEYPGTAWHILAGIMRELYSLQEQSENLNTN